MFARGGLELLFVAARRFGEAEKVKVRMQLYRRRFGEMYPFVVEWGILNIDKSTKREKQREGKKRQLKGMGSQK